MEHKAEETLWTPTFIWMLIIACLNLFSLSMVNQLLSTYMVEYYQATPSQVGTISCLMILCALLFRPFAGYLVDRFGRKWTLIGSLVLSSIGNLIMLSNINLVGLGFLRFLIGIPFSINTISINTLTADIIPKERLSDGLGITTVATNIIGMVIAPNVGFWLINKSGFNVVFISSIIFALAAIILIIKLKVEDIKNTGVAFSFRSVFIPRVAGLAAILGILFFGWPGISSYSPLYSSELGIANRGTFLLFFGAGSILSRLINKRIKKQGWPSNPGKLSILLILIGNGLIGLFNSIPSFLFSGLVLGLGYGFAFSVFPAMAIELVKPEERGKSNATIFLGQDIGAFTGLLSYGFIAESTGSYRYPYLVTAILMVIPLLLFIFKVLPHYYENKSIQ